MRCSCAVGKVVGVYSESFIHFLLFSLVPKMKPILYFILCVFAVLTFTSLSWTSSLLKWALCRLWMSFWISFSSCDDHPFLLLTQSLWTKLLFFCSEGTAAHDPVGTQSVIFYHYVTFVLSSPLFVARLCNILIIITQVEDIFTKAVLIMPRKKNLIMFMQVREVHNVNHEILGASLCDNHNRCPFLLLLWIFGRPPKRVIGYQRYHNASKQLAAWPEVTACLELFEVFNTAQTKLKWGWSAVEPLSNVSEILI